MWDGLLMRVLHLVAEDSAALPIATYIDLIKYIMPLFRHHLFVGEEQTPKSLQSQLLYRSQMRRAGTSP
jgi:hypothetical protein